jgi:hypothetical protein
MKKLFFTLLFQVGVNVIGIPEFHKHIFTNYEQIKSKFHK